MGSGWRLDEPVEERAAGGGVDGDVAGVLSEVNRRLAGQAADSVLLLLRRRREGHGRRRHQQYQRKAEMGGRQERPGGEPHCPFCLSVAERRWKERIYTMRDIKFIRLHSSERLTISKFFKLI